MATDPLSPGDLQQRRYWDDHAASYDRSMALAERRILRDTRSWVCEQATGRTLEVAIGTGLNLRWYPAGVDLVGIELSPRMLQIARRRAAELGITADLREGTAQALDFPDDNFDTVISTLALCSIPDEALAVREMIRVLRPAGALILADHVESSLAPVRLAQRGLELFTRRVGEHFTRRPIRHLYAAGMQIERHERLLAGVIERVAARKPAW